MMPALVPKRGGTLAGALVVLGMVACAPAPVAAPPPAAPQPKAYLVLLPDADGSVGQVSFKAEGAETILDQANAATRLGGAVGNRFTATKEDVAKDFAAALAASPTAPQTFLLYFEAGGARLVPASSALIDAIKKDLVGRSHPDMSVIGHTDTAGDDAVNLRLGLERARFVANLLTDQATANVPVQIESHGEKNQLVKTPDNTPEPRNRRVEVTVR